MLIITITKGQRVELVREGELLGTLEVTHRTDGRIRLALEFPKDIKIMRGELADAVQGKERVR